MAERLVDVLNGNKAVIQTYPITIGDSDIVATDAKYEEKALEAARRGHLVPDGDLKNLTARMRVCRSGAMTPYEDSGGVLSQTKQMLDQAVRGRAYVLWQQDGCKPSVQHRTEDLAGLHILVVGDEVRVVMMLEEMLQDFGCSVELAPNIEKALAVVRDQVLDGVLLDMNIDGQKTIAVVEELVSLSVPFLLITGDSAQNRDPPGIKAAPRLQKPFDAEVLARRMVQVFVLVGES